MKGKDNYKKVESENVIFMRKQHY